MDLKGEAAGVSRPMRVDHKFPRLPVTHHLLKVALIPFIVIDAPRKKPRDSKFKGRGGLWTLFGPTTRLRVDHDWYGWWVNLGGTQAI